MAKALNKFIISESQPKLTNVGWIKPIEDTNRCDLLFYNNGEWISEGETSLEFEDLAEKVNGKQDALTLTVKDNGNIVIGNIQGQTKEFMPATPSGDPMHYAYVAAGAEYNDTGADIVKTTPWTDLADDDVDKTVVHKAGYWYLNGLGDITNEQMRFIYIKTYNVRLSGLSLNTADTSLTAFLRNNKTCRTNFAFIDSQWTNVILSYYKFCRTFQDSFCEVVIVGDTGAGVMVGNDNYFAFYSPIIKHIEGVLRLGPNYKDFSLGLFSTGLETVRIVQLASNLKMDTCSNLTSKSILYMINNEAATSAITITLHADAYARAMANADILAALETHTNVSLASA